MQQKRCQEQNTSVQKDKTSDQKPGNKQIRGKKEGGLTCKIQDFKPTISKQVKVTERKLDRKCKDLNTYG